MSTGVDPGETAASTATGAPTEAVRFAVANLFRSGGAFVLFGLGLVGSLAVNEASANTREPESAPCPKEHLKQKGRKRCAKT